MASKSEIARNEILKAIRERRIEAGQQIPSEREFATLLGMNHRTIRRALEELVLSGEIEKRPRVGSFLRDVSQPVPLAVALPSYFLSAGGRHLITGLILEGLNEVIDHRSYSLTALPYRPDHFAEDIGRLLPARNIRGLLLMGNWQIPPSAVKDLMDSGVEIVLLTRHPALIALGLPSIHTDPAPAISTLIRGLVERGHQQLAIARYSHPRQPEITALIEEACRVHQLGCPEALTVTLPNSHGTIDFDPLRSLIAAKSRPSAIIVPDEVAAGIAFREAYRIGLNIPRDFSLAAYTDLTPGVHPVPLTAPDSAPNVRKMASMAAQHLLSRLKKCPVTESHISMTANVLWRESVGAPAAAQPTKRPVRRPSTRSGFSLLELVAAMVITFILAAFSVQAFKQAKARARLSASAQNQRQIVMGLMSYASDHNGVLPQMVALDSPISPGYTVFWPRTLVYYRYITNPSIFFRPGTTWWKGSTALHNPESNTTIPWAYPSYGVNAYGAMPQKSQPGGTYDDRPASLYQIGAELSQLMLLRDVHHPSYPERGHGWYWWGGGGLTASYIPPDDGDQDGMMSAAFADGHVEVYQIAAFREMIAASQWSGPPEYNRVWTRKQ